jgi:type VI secretion system protein VasD
MCKTATTSAHPCPDEFARSVVARPLLPAKALGVSTLAALLSALQACSMMTPKPVPLAPPAVTQIHARIEASTQLNPNIRERASPLVLRIYELKTATTFSSADFVSLFEHDDAQLGADLVAKDELVLEPGEARVYSKLLSTDTRFIGVFGAYRDLEHGSWRGVFAIQPGKSQVALILAGPRDIDAHAVR